MTADFSSAIRNAEGALTVARDKLTLYERLYKQWRDEVNVCTRVLERLREAEGVPVDAPILTPVVEAEKDIPLPESIVKARPVTEEERREAGKLVDTPLAAAIQEVRARASSPFQTAANGFDRNAVKRQLRNWNVSYPLAKSYEHASQLARQACITELSRHPDYFDKWLEKGHVPLTHSLGGVTVEVVENCAKILGVNLRSIRDHAFRLQADVAVYGVRGMDYVW